MLIVTRNWSRVIHNSLTSSNRNRSLSLLCILKIFRTLTSIQLLRFISRSWRSLASLFSYIINNQILSWLTISVVRVILLWFWFRNNIVMEVISFRVIWNRHLMGIIDIFSSMVIENNIRSKRRIDEVVIFNSFLIRRLFSEIFYLCSFEGRLYLGYRVISEHFLISY